jgi:hypothetical protein
MMNGLAVNPQGYLPSVPNPWVVAGMGDANGDARSDVFWRNPATGQNYLWIMNAMLITSQGYLPTVAASGWEVAGVADYSGDGKADVLWRNNTTGQTYLWIMNGLAISSQGFLLTIADVNWEVVGSPDANGDLRADVLWRQGLGPELRVDDERPRDREPRLPADHLGPELEGGGLRRLQRRRPWRRPVAPCDHRTELSLDAEWHQCDDAGVPAERRGGELAAGEALNVIPA